jgi:hypothetical protein
MSTSTAPSTETARLIAHLKHSVEVAEACASRVDDAVLAMNGMTGTKTRHFYNALGSLPGARYLEVGTWSGSSFCAALCGNAMECATAVDNWSQFGGPKAEFEANLESYRGANGARFVEGDCFDPATVERVASSGLPGGRQRYNIYVYDGHHSEESHYKALTEYAACMDDAFIFVVDDWNWSNVRDGTKNAIMDLGLRVAHRFQIIYTTDNAHTPMDVARREWWNGIGMFVLEKPAGAQ